MYDCNHTLSTTYDGRYWLITYVNGDYAIVPVVNIFHTCPLCGKVSHLDYNIYTKRERAIILNKER